jgi:hypothetical protein
MATGFDADIAAVPRIGAAPRILEVVCRQPGSVRAPTHDGSFETSIANSANPIPPQAAVPLPSIASTVVDSLPDETRFTFRMPTS